jgi:hypothetical protein
VFREPWGHVVLSVVLTVAGWGAIGYLATTVRVRGLLGFLVGLYWPRRQS